MIVRQFNSSCVVFQPYHDEYGVAEQAIAVSVDTSGLIVLNQEGREILINRSSVPDLVRVLRELVKKDETK